DSLHLPGDVRDGMERVRSRGMGPPAPSDAGYRITHQTFRWRPHFLSPPCLRVSASPCESLRFYLVPV
ncbi:MAG: hypothetical protein ACKPGI_07735, partial [Verrucomicrobiota bacterium]